jgi:hypothetical protein
MSSTSITFSNFSMVFYATASKNSRQMLRLDYTQYELRAGTIPLYLDNFLWSLNDFFDLLDIIKISFQSFRVLSSALGGRGISKDAVGELV